jgi:hypothetical protein
MNPDKTLLESTQGFLTGIASRWILKVAGTFLATVGLQTGQVEEIIGGIVAVLLGIAVSLIQHKKAVNQPTS